MRCKYHSCWFPHKKKKSYYSDLYLYNLYASCKFNTTAWQPFFSLVSSPPQPRRNSPPMMEHSQHVLQIWVQSVCRVLMLPSRYHAFIGWTRWVSVLPLYRCISIQKQTTCVAQKKKKKTGCTALQPFPPREHFVSSPLNKKSFKNRSTTQLKHRLKVTLAKMMITWYILNPYLVRVLHVWESSASRKCEFC